MNEETQNHTSEQMQTEPHSSEETPLETNEVVSESAGSSSRNMKMIIGAIVVVIVFLLALWYAMERSGRVDTDAFSFIERGQLQREVIAEINNEEISAYDLAISQEQIATAAAVQGADVTDPDTLNSIRDQALEMLVNTELLRQEAEARGISVTEDDVTARYDQLVAEVGGEEVLLERMKSFGVTESILLRDIENELTIQQLLDQLFESQVIEVTEAEVLDLYEAAGGEDAGLPPLEQLRPQIEAQISTTKEQEIVSNFVEDLRAKATINIFQ